MTRGIRLCNPGNIRISPQHWLGKLDPSTDPEFEDFHNMIYGIRAMALLILNYYRISGLDTIRKVVEKYAPPSENPTNAYIDNVSDRTGFDPDAVLDLEEKDDLLAVVKGMCDQEQGAAIAQVSDEQFSAGVDMALASIKAA